MVVEHILGNPRNEYIKNYPRNPRNSGSQSKHICGRTKADRIANRLEDMFDVVNQDYRGILFRAASSVSEARINRIAEYALSNSSVKVPIAYFIRCIMNEPGYKKYMSKKRAKSTTTM